MFHFLKAGDATRVGLALADDFVTHSTSASPNGRQEGRGSPAVRLQKLLQRFLQRVDQETRPLQLNIFKRATLANSFKWRLLEKGVEPQIVDELTQALVLRLTAVSAPTAPAEGHASLRRGVRDTKALLLEADQHASKGAYREAVESYREALRVDRRSAAAENRLGEALCTLGDCLEAEAHFRRAIGLKPDHPDAHLNLGTLLRWKGQTVESEMPLRRALKLKPAHVDAQVSLAMTLFQLGRADEARNLLDKALKVAPRHAEALSTLGQLSARQGRFAEAEGFFRRALEVDAKAPVAWVGLAGLRRMNDSDTDWLKGALQSAEAGMPPLHEAHVRFAIGKYYDDAGDFGRAFHNYQRANELVKTAAEPYDRLARARLVDDLTRTYERDLVTRSAKGASDSHLPVFVVGMPRSGTTLVDQIIASHPAARAAGELPYWSNAVYKHAAILRHGPPEESLRRKLAESYLRVLSEHARHAQRVTDKGLFNSDYLGIIHSTFPKARMIYVRRDPIDTCLSCYFQDFPPALNFALDLSDLAHYYAQHQRLMAHWRSILPPEALLEVPYEGLIVDQENWSRRILDFVGLQWDPKCLDFDLTESTVLTASYWQVRQKVYSTSVGRRRNYEKFIGPLLSLT